MFAVFDYSWIVIALIVLIAGILVDRLNRWWSPIRVRRMLARTERETAQGTYQKPVLMPESLHVVSVDHEGVSCKHPDEAIESVRWNDLLRVEIITNDLGPFLPDVFWVLIGAESQCNIPQGSTGEEAFYDKLYALPSVDFAAASRAMCSAENQRFVIWVKGSV